MGGAYRGGGRGVTLCCHRSARKGTWLPKQRHINAARNQTNNSTAYRSMQRRKPSVRRNSTVAMSHYTINRMRENWKKARL